MLNKGTQPPQCAWFIVLKLVLLQLSCCVLQLHSTIPHCSFELVLTDILLQPLFPLLIVAC